MKPRQSVGATRFTAPWSSGLGLFVRAVFLQDADGGVFAELKSVGERPIRLLILGVDVGAFVDKQSYFALEAEMDGAVKDGVAVGIGDVGIGAVIEEEFYVVLLIAHDGPEERCGAAGGSGVDIGSVSDEKLHQLIVVCGKLGEVERGVPVFQLVRGHALGIEGMGRVCSLRVQEDDGVLMVVAGELLAQVVGDEGRVIVLCIDVGAGIDEDLSDRDLAVESSLMEGSVSILIFVVDELRIGGEEFLDLFDVAFAGRVVDGAAEGRGGEGDGSERDGERGHEVSGTRNMEADQRFHFL